MKQQRTRSNVGLILLAVLVMASINSTFVYAKHTKHDTHVAQRDSSYNDRLQFDPQNTPDMIKEAKDALDGYIKIKEAADVANKLKAFKQLSGALGIVGSLVGFIFSFFGSGPDPEILKLQEMIKQTQTLIVLGNEEILNAIRQLNSKEAQRSAMDSMNILDVLVTKHMVDKLEYDVGGYDVLPCGQAMTLCNNAFIDLSKKLDDILSASFEESPRGNQTRVQFVGDGLMLLLSNALYSLSWVNAKYYKNIHPEVVIADTDTQKIAQISQATTQQNYYDTYGVAAYERWAQKMKFQTCRLCTSCGGDYPVYGGEGFKENEWGHWQRFREHCTGELYSESGPPHLCCSADKPPVQYCRTCGGDYPYRIGKRINAGDYGPYKILQDSCSSFFYHTKDEFEICTRSRKQCKMCQGNCNDGYTQVGKIERIDDWGAWAAYDEYACFPENNKDVNNVFYADVSLCCLDQTGEW
eukprot:403362451